MFGIGLGELIVIFLVIFILFGPRALPEIAKTLGQIFKSFQKEVKDIKSELALTDDDEKTQKTESEKEK